MPPISQPLSAKNTWTAKLMDKLQTLPQLRDVATDQQTRGSQASLVIDRVTASRLGITPQAIDDTLYDAFGQRQIATLFTQLNQYHVILETMPEFQKNPAKLQDIYVRSSSGEPVPLSTFTHFETGTAPLAINRQGQFPAVTISFNLAPGTSHLRTSIERGQELMRALRGRVSGLCQPTYVLDIPGGHGKSPIGPDYLTQDEAGRVQVEDFNGTRHVYPPQA